MDQYTLSVSAFPLSASSPPPAHKRLRLIAILSVSQLVGWGTTFDMPSVLARPMARDLGMPFETIFAGLSVMMVMVALASPRVGRLLVALGAARVLATGSALLGLGLGALAASEGAVSYFAAWFVIGLGGAFALTVPANTAVVERERLGAKRTMSTLSIFTGLSSAIFWPLLSFADAAFGWRVALLAAAGCNVFLLLPLHLFGLPPKLLEAPQPVATATPGAEAQIGNPSRLLALILIAAGSSLIALMTFGISPSLIELLKRSGATPELALTLGSLRAVIGISARFGSTLVIERISTVASGLAGSLVLLAAFGMLTLFAPSYLAPAAFVPLYGAGAGIVTIVRTLLPLAFFSRAEFALISSRVALAQYTATAIAPFLFAAILENFGLTGVLTVSIGLALAFLGVMLGLSRIRTSPVEGISVAS